MKVTINLQKPISNYSFGYSLYESPNTATWYDSNVITITNSGSYYIFVKNKSTSFIEKVQRVYVNCLNGAVVCAINYTVVKNLSVCTIDVVPVKAITKSSIVCTINYTSIVSISSCPISYVPTVKIN